MNDEQPTRSWSAAYCVGALLILQTALLGWAATRHSPGIDEVGHLVAGLHHWQTGTFDLYRVNPPLVRLIATAPLAAAGVEMDNVVVDTRPPARPEFDLGRELWDRHGEATFCYLTWARWACLPFAWLGTCVIYLWGRDLYGPKAGAFGAGLWVVCPTTLTNAQMIAPDTGATVFGAFACYLFWQWLRCPNWGQALAAGVVLGLAESCKATWLILFPLWPLLWVVYRFRGEVGWGQRGGEVVQLGAAIVLSLFVLNAGYGFEGVGKRLGEYPFVSQTLTTENTLGARVNRFSESVLGQLPVPLPKNYVQGIDVQKRDFESGMRSYLRGEWRGKGWWYYYLYGLLVKTPLGTLFLVGLAAVSWPFLRPPGASWREELVLIAPALVVLGFVSSQTGFNHHIRYVLPVLPFLFIGVGRLTTYGGRYRWSWWAILLTAAGAAAVSSLRVYPHSMSYFNEAVGGPMKGADHLIDSNIDWGQDLLYLKEWYEAHPEARPFHFGYFGYVDPQTVGIKYTLPPKGPITPADYVRPDVHELGPQPGWYAISVSLLKGITFPVCTGRGGMEYISEPSFVYFQQFRPVATAGYSIWIYHITPEECDQVRAQMGLPPFAEPVGVERGSR